MSPLQLNERRAARDAMTGKQSSQKESRLNGLVSFVSGAWFMISDHCSRETCHARSNGPRDGGPHSPPRSMEATLASIETRSRRVCERAEGARFGARCHGGSARERSYGVEALRLTSLSEKQVSNRRDSVLRLEPSAVARIVRTLAGDDPSRSMWMIVRTASVVRPPERECDRACASLTRKDETVRGDKDLSLRTG